MTKINNVDLDKVSNTVTKGKEDKNTLKKPVKLQGEWNLDPNSEYQFKTELSFEKGSQVIEIDSPSFLGGDGNRLGPMAYCIAGITSCFIGTFVGIAAQQGVKLTKLKVMNHATNLLSLKPVFPHSLLVTTATPCKAPQKIKVHPAPCHSPPRRKVIIRLK